MAHDKDTHKHFKSISNKFIYYLELLFVMFLSCVSVCADGRLMKIIHSY